MEECERKEDRRYSSLGTYGAAEKDFYVFTLGYQGLLHQDECPFHSQNLDEINIVIC